MAHQAFGTAEADGEIDELQMVQHMMVTIQQQRLETIGRMMGQQQQVMQDMVEGSSVTMKRGTEEE